MGGASVGLLMASVAIDLLKSRSEQQAIQDTKSTEIAIANVQAKEEAIAIQNQLFQTLSQNIAANEAQGLALVGTPQRVQAMNIQSAAAATGTVMGQSRLNKAALRASAQQQRRMSEIGLYGSIGKKVAYVGISKKKVGDVGKGEPKKVGKFESYELGETWQRDYF